MTMLNGPGLKKTIILKDLIVELPFLGQGGIRSADLVCTIFSIMDIIIPILEPTLDGRSQHHH